MTLHKTLDCKEIKPVNPKGNQSRIFVGRTDAEAETPIPWPHDAKNWFIGKDPDLGKDWRQKKGTREDEVVGWHHWLDGHQFEQVLGVGDGQGSLVCCSPWGRKESDTTEWLNWTDELTILLPGIYPKKIIIQKDTCTPVLIAALFTIARTWKQPKRSSTDKW